MKSITIRDFRTRPNTIRKEIENDSEALLTIHGKPFALVTSVNEMNLEEITSAFRIVRAQMALKKIHVAAKKNGTADFSLSEITEEIRKTRRTLYKKAKHAGRFV